MDRCSRATHLLDVEASPDEVTRLQGYSGIDRVTKLELPPRPGNVARQEKTDSYFVFPKYGKNEQQCNEIETALKNLLKDKFRKPYKSGDIDKTSTTNRKASSFLPFQESA